MNSRSLRSSSREASLKVLPTSTRLHWSQLWASYRIEQASKRKIASFNFDTYCRSGCCFRSFSGAVITAIVLHFVMLRSHRKIGRPETRHKSNDITTKACKLLLFEHPCCRFGMARVMLVSLRLCVFHSYERKSRRKSSPSDDLKNWNFFVHFWGF